MGNSDNTPISPFGPREIIKDNVEQAKCRPEGSARTSFQIKDQKMDDVKSKSNEKRLQSNLISLE